MTTPELIAECRALLLMRQNKRTYDALMQIMQRLIHYNNRPDMYELHNTNHALIEIGSRHDATANTTTKIFVCTKCGEVRRVTY